jgi:hypothetical protein
MYKLTKAQKKLKVKATPNSLRGFDMEKCNHSWIDCDNEGMYGIEECRYCGEKRHK